MRVISFRKHIFLYIDTTSEIKAEHLSVSSKRLDFEWLYLNFLYLIGCVWEHFFHFFKLLSVLCLFSNGWLFNNVWIGRTNIGVRKLWDCWLRLEPIKLRMGLCIILLVVTVLICRVIILLIIIFLSLFVDNLSPCELWLCIYVHECSFSIGIPIVIFLTLMLILLLLIILILWLSLMLQLMFP